MTAIHLLEKIFYEGKNTMWQYSLMYDGSLVVMVEAWLAHKIIYFHETPSGEFHIGIGVCLCSFPSGQ